MKKLKELRNEIGISQKSLALKFDTSTQVISRYERGEREPNFDLLINIANFFGVSVDYLIGASDYRQEKNKNIELTKDEAELLSLFRSTDEDGKSFLLTAARKINAPGILRKNAL